MTDFLADRCRKLVLEVAKKHNVAPCLITAHVRHEIADEARKEVMRRMIVEFGFRRSRVARIFGRDLRRVRRSVLGV